MRFSIVSQRLWCARRTRLAGRSCHQSHIYKRQMCSNEPRTLLARHRYSSAEVSSVVLLATENGRKSERFSFFDHTARYRAAFSLAAVGAGSFVASVGVSTFWDEETVRVALESKTRVLSCGLNLVGQLGQSSDRSYDRPSKIEALDDEKAVKVFAGGNSSAMITVDGRLLSWGKGEYGCLGHGDDSFLTVPKVCQYFASSGIQVVDVAIGTLHMLALDSNLKLYSWGRSLPSGHHDSGHKMVPQALDGELGAKKVISISAGYMHSAAVTDQGEVYTWGSGYCGQLGNGKKSDLKAPQRVEALGHVKAKKVACGRDFTMVLTETGDLYSFGSDDYGQLGLGKSHGERFVLLPRNVLASNLVDIVCGDYHCLAVDKDDAIWSWGLGREGQLGNGEKSDQSVPKILKSFGHVSTTKSATPKVVCGGGHSAIVVDKECYMFGRGRDGQLGRGGNLESVAGYHVSPVKVDTGDINLVYDVALGFDHSVFLCHK
eukprot:CAMPEP_0184700282 /NCGR_PEP_ID=MMETSP0313-20130426/11491_1 /TAXON_ID=2792 /ORGANISM="Porphyridium aerugineum, Strain SAG 1380-2" /LENGTH=488 /DNA_ID=CAMNT_0027159871 /DNA_START=74 /DNA_END=1540 /DNA_ORIENTATION=-